MVLWPMFDGSRNEEPGPKRPKPNNPRLPSGKAPPQSPPPPGKGWDLKDYIGGAEMVGRPYHVFGYHETTGLKNPNRILFGL